MSLALYMDEHVPLAITAALRRRGVEVLTVQEDGYSARLDPDILDRATALGHLLYTEDSDFLVQAHRRQQSGVPFSGIAYAHPLMVTIGQRVNDLELVAKLGEPDEFADRVEYLPLRPSPPSQARFTGRRWSRLVARPALCRATLGIRPGRGWRPGS